MPKVSSAALFALWSQREQEAGRRITIKEVAEKTGLSPETLRNLRNGDTSRYDGTVLASVCEFFGVEAGPVPFLVFDPANE